eukprot:gnl/MRDRNA2_/MRDRNA2_121588_c0_seq1.p1 gnl/MRDRNA2_/MRDRNA2_121588_c0~~gnl/MRDRNA2_/MRDRNA2_121588_c0_seq1.p1  ORF type:complete len:217 (+),score=46.75 gnl/MRDRNA2_/MRDRNA2_121588_c0_seq1:184-834(+)
MASEDEIEFTVQLMSGEVIATVPVCSSALISSVKKMVEEAEGTPAWQQSFFLEGIPLEDDADLSKYGPFENGQVAVMLVRKTCFMPSDRFDGSRPGYAFRLGERGLGYYVDEYEKRVDNAASVHVLDGYWNADSNGGTVVIEGGVIYWSWTAGGAVFSNGSSQLVDLEGQTFSTKPPESNDDIVARMDGIKKLVWEKQPLKGFATTWERVFTSDAE